MVAQPALTKSIRKLEAYFGAPLFERLPRGSFTGGALIRRALEKYLPLTTLVGLVRDEAAKGRRSAARIPSEATVLGRDVTTNGTLLVVFLPPLAFPTPFS